MHSTKRLKAEGVASLPLPNNVPVNDTDVLGYIQLTGDNESQVTESEWVADSDTEEEYVALGDEK